MHIPIIEIVIGNNMETWDAELSITEANAVQSEKNKALKAIRIGRLGESSFVLYMQLTWCADEMFLCTTRTRSEPREFKHMGRLIEYIEAAYPSVKKLQITLDQDSIGPRRKPKAE